MCCYDNKPILEQDIKKLREERLRFINDYYKKHNINQDCLSNGGRRHRDLYDDVCVEHAGFGKKVRGYDNLIALKEKELGRSLFI